MGQVVAGEANVNLANCANRKTLALAKAGARPGFEPTAFGHERTKTFARSIWPAGQCLDANLLENRLTTCTARTSLTTTKLKYQVHQSSTSRPMLRSRYRDADPRRYRDADPPSGSACCT
eukprot:s8700_g2.t1